MNQEDIVTQLEEAKTLRNNGREVESIELYKKILRSLPDSERSTRGMISEEIGVCYKIMNELVSAREWYQKALLHLYFLLPVPIYPV